MTTITASDIIVAARGRDTTLAARAFTVINNDGDGWNPDDEYLGTLVGRGDGFDVYDDHGDAVIVANDAIAAGGGEWAARVCADEPLVVEEA